MTLCIVIRTREGFVGLGDSAVITGALISTKSKLAIHTLPHGTCFTLTSGLRSISDKVLSYAGDTLPASGSKRLFEVANEFGQLLRRVREEDAEELQRSRLEFDAHMLLGGLCTGDPSPTAYLIYPQGNWIEVGRDAPYLTIGRSSSAYPLLKSLISVNLPLSLAANVGILAIDAAAASIVNVRYPIDIAVLADHATNVVHRQLTEADVAPLLAHWRSSLKSSLDKAPALDIGISSTP